MTYCFDIDGTICTNTEGRYGEAEPFRDVIGAINNLFEAGHRILLCTARGSTTGIEWRPVTESQLSTWGVRYHELLLGKPTADIYIDDKAVNFDEWRLANISSRGTGELNAEMPAESFQMSATRRLVYFNGELVPESEARISIYDSALMFGDMVFEMTRSFNRHQFKLREHLERLFCSIRMLQIPLEMTIDEMETAVLETIQANRDAFAADDEDRVMIDISRGLLGIYEDTVDLRKGPNVIIAVFPLRWTVRGMGRLFEHGINAVVPSQRAIPADLMDPKIKNRSRLHYLMANIEASQFKGDDNWALLLDPDGYVAEGTGDNFFIVKDGTIVTPEGRNILRGISRDYVMKDLASQVGLPVCEKNFGLYDVVNADEAFMTGTPFCLLPVCRINGSPIGTGVPGEFTNALLRQWNTNVGIDIPAQIKGWDASAGPLVSSSPTPYSFRGKNR